MNVIYIAHYTTKTIFNLFNLLVQQFDSFLFINFMIRLFAVKNSFIVI